MSQSGDGRGYLKVSVCIKGDELTRLVHGLVAEAFLGPRPDGAQVNHLDGVKSHNFPTNLEYCSAAQNYAHAIRTGLAPVGARHGRYTSPECTARGERVNTARLSSDQVLEMRALRASGIRVPELMARFGVAKTTAHQVVNRKTWRHLP